MLSSLTVVKDLSGCIYESVCVESCYQECVKQAVGLLSVTGSYLGVQIQTGALLVCEGSREDRRFKTVAVSYPQTRHRAALQSAMLLIGLLSYATVALSV